MGSVWAMVVAKGDAAPDATSGVISEDQKKADLATLCQLIGAMMAVVIDGS